MQQRRYSTPDSHIHYHWQISIIIIKTDYIGKVAKATHLVKSAFSKAIVLYFHMDKECFFSYDKLMPSVRDLSQSSPVQASHSKDN